MTPEKSWEVEIYGYVPEVFQAATAAQARYRAFLVWRDGVAYESFATFLRRGVKVRPITARETA